MPKNKLSIYLLIIILGFSNCKSTNEIRKTIYENNFDSGNTANLSNTKISDFNQTKVLGNFNNDGFTLTLNQIPSHELIEISFDLYIHDSWDGNKASNGIDGPDMWSMIIEDLPIISTTFSNTICNNSYVFCPPQSYPDNYPNNNHNPRSGSVDILLPGFCSLKNTVGGTSLYKIKKTIKHQQSILTLKCIDQLVQTNVDPSICDESWSIDNLKIESIKLN